GHVIEATSGAGVPGALVRVIETGQTIATNRLGKFAIPVQGAGEYTLSISYLGYTEKLWRVRPDTPGGSPSEFRLETSALNVDEVTVFGPRSARAKALNLQRTAENNSFVVSSDVLGNFPGTTIAEALRRVPGVAFNRDYYSGDGTSIILRGLGPEMNAI